MKILDELKSAMHTLTKTGRLADPNFVMDKITEIEREILKMEALKKLHESSDIHQLNKIIALNFRCNMIEPKYPDGERRSGDGLMEHYDNCMKWYQKAKEIERMDSASIGLPVANEG
jgi:hypothetical protein